MVTVYREAGFRIVIYLEDHEPAHVHVLGDGSVKINLFTAGGAPEIVHVKGMRFGDARKALQIVREQHAYLVIKWVEIHG